MNAPTCLDVCVFYAMNIYSIESKNYMNERIILCFNEKVVSLLLAIQNGLIDIYQ